ncbi:MAG: GtrA family protein [Microcystis aeruginosa Ma_OC_H_19870700_S124]|uniref:GtrA family protein n=1 Tax=Microcystis aeruginosa Ma_OC_H_19870700_S124 TaxID=2486262 RepID=A0A552AEU1_MICAE|nr:MAG: GtrA family protein [Microcystis aeruginosa Ma_OC_H_19870700_S124]
MKIYEVKLSRKKSKKFQYKFRSIQLLRDIIDSKFIKFAFIGAFCTALNLGLLYLLTSIAKLNYIISTLIALIAINFIGFYLNKYYTFKTDQKRFLPELWKYYSVMLSSFILNLFFMFVLVQLFNMWYIYASLTITLGFLFYNFFMHKNWSFK